MQCKQLLKNTLLTGATILSLSVSGNALANPTTETRGPNGATVIVQVPMMDSEFPMMSAKLGMAVTPFNLVFLAYQGFFAGEDIPSGSALVRAYRAGEVNATDLTKVAIGMNRLPESSLQDEYFLAQVQSQLRALASGDN